MLAAAPARSFGKWGRKNVKGKSKAVTPPAEATKEPSVKLAARVSKAPAKKRAPASLPTKPPAKPKTKAGPKAPGGPTPKAAAKTGAKKTTSTKQV
jgi:hypothetical protein